MQENRSIKIGQIQVLSILDLMILKRVGSDHINAHTHVTSNNFCGSGYEFSFGIPENRGIQGLDLESYSQAKESNITHEGWIHRKTGISWWHLGVLIFPILKTFRNCKSHSPVWLWKRAPSVFNPNKNQTSPKPKPETVYLKPSNHILLSIFQ